MRISLPYGEGTSDIDIPDICRTSVLYRPEAGAAADNAAEPVEDALNHPLGDVLESVVEQRASDLGKNVSELNAVIVVSDATRGVPNDAILKSIISRLETVGVRRDNMAILIACGKHRQPYEDEMARIVNPAIIKGIRVVAHEAGKSETTYVGTTSYGTEVHIDSNYVRADLRIITGMIEAHQLAGFSGGAKSVFIGLGSEQTISHNHSLLVRPSAKMGIFEGNPVREDIEEGFGFIGTDFMLNVVLDTQKLVLKAFAGTYSEAYKEGVRFAADASVVYFDEPADIAIVSCGGHPKDINMYQAQKALAHIDPMLKPGGVAVLLARCSDGVGEGLFMQWMHEASSPRDVLDRFQREGFILGAHKAFLLARSLDKFKTFLVSDLDEKTARDLFFIPSPTAQTAVDEAVEQCRNAGILNPSVIVVPQGIGILPKKY
ncbi:nickel-dependent lactate racemase [Mahella australiensis]|uniref:Uncharacterized protein n=1 Tax=Mahella australiensis (strain DSM 15567 / CIP 107919 / 50-1 BON) TaxID=697281 RepID=F3ZZ60_MAHA5|nr:nickel-dependent lactate racemase [Mahella australiensis]AEE97842.1 Protein of unknown function DUF2088 [Mahella australiensis 50-1 BON]